MDIAPTNECIIRHFLRVAKFLLNCPSQTELRIASKSNKRFNYFHNVDSTNYFTKLLKIYTFLYGRALSFFIYVRFEVLEIPLKS